MMKKMDKALSSTLITISMKAIGKMAKEKEKVSIVIAMETIIKELGLETKNKEKEF